MKRYIQSMLGVWLICLTGNVAAAVSAHVDRSVITEAETLKLTIAAPAQTASPDWEPLEHDFDIVNTAHNSRISIVNGKMDSRNEWVLMLAPKRTGDLTIPALSVGGARTQAIPLKIVPAGAQGGGTAIGKDLFLEAGVEPDAVYVQGQAIYIVRLFQDVDIKEGSLSAPAINDAIVERVGEDVNYETSREGRRYRVIERRYAIFPQTSGALKIPPVEFNGQVAVPGSSPLENFFNRRMGSDPFEQFFDRGRAVRLRSPELTLEVKPQPKTAASQWWLPARDVQLTESWSPDPPLFRVGEPITRTLTLAAVGLTGQQLPDLPKGEGTQFKAYPDQPSKETLIKDKNVVAKKEQKVAMVATAPGVFTLPPVEIHWWDTVNDKPQVATLPARRVEVLPAAGSAAVMSAPLAVPDRDISASAPSLGITENALQPAGVADGMWRAIALAAIGIWVMTLMAWGGYARRRKKIPQGHDPAPNQAFHTSLKTKREAVAKACAQGDPQHARNALLEWASACWPEDPPRSLTALGQRMPSEAPRNAITNLEKILYAPAGAAWDHQAFLASIAPTLKEWSARVHSSPRSLEDVLPPLYPVR